MKALARIGLSALVHAHFRQINAAAMLRSLRSFSRNRVLIDSENVCACVWSIPRPNMLPFFVRVSIATQHLSMLQVACTALGVNHCLLKGRTFDMCIVDEAGQMTLPVALGPILHSKYGAVSSCLFDFTCTETTHIRPEFVCSSSHSLNLPYTFTHSFICSFIHSFIILHNCLPPASGLYSPEWLPA
jgi:hypothetical protein